MEVLQVILYILYIGAALILILMVLFRPGEGGGGLGGAFGGLGGDTAFGVKTTQLIDKIIVWVAVVFILVAIVLTSMVNHARKAGGSESEDGDSQSRSAPVDPSSERPTRLL